jgi:hypothetical protein
METRQDAITNYPQSGAAAQGFSLQESQTGRKA